MATNAWTANSQNSVQPARNEMEELLSRLFSEGVGDKLEEMTYKPSATTNAKPNTTNKTATVMGNGKDFFLELRKQVVSLSEKEKAGG